MRYTLYHSSKNKQHIEVEIDMGIVFDDFYKMIVRKNELDFYLKIEEYFFNNADIEHNGNSNFIATGEKTFKSLSFFNSKDFKELLENYFGFELKKMKLINFKISNNAIKKVKIYFEPKKNINNAFYKNKLDFFSKTIPSKHLFLKIKNKGFIEERTLIEYEFIYDKDYLEENEEYQIIEELKNKCIDKRLHVQNDNNLIKISVFEVYQKKVN